MSTHATDSSPDGPEGPDGADGEPHAKRQRVSQACGPCRVRFLNKKET